MLDKFIFGKKVPIFVPSSFINECLFSEIYPLFSMIDLIIPIIFELLQIILLRLRNYFKDKCKSSTNTTVGTFYFDL